MTNLKFGSFFQITNILSQFLSEAEFIFKIYFILYKWLFCMHTCISLHKVHAMTIEAKRGLELGLQRVLSHCSQTYLGHHLLNNDMETFY